MEDNLEKQIELTKKGNKKVNKDLYFSEEGKFKPGNPGGTVIPHGKRIGNYKKLFLDICKPKVMKKLIMSLVKDALEGDKIARKEILDRVLGKAQEHVEIEGMDFKALQIQFSRETPDNTPKNVGEQINRIENGVIDTCGKQAKMVQEMCNSIQIMENRDKPD